MINTLQFWLKVKEEFASPERPYLCLSQTFREYWQADPNRTMHALARNFLSGNQDDFYVGNSILFFTGKSHGMLMEKYDDLSRAIRLDFIEWNLKRLS